MIDALTLRLRTCCHHSPRADLHTQTPHIIATQQTQQTHQQPASVHPLKEQIKGHKTSGDYAVSSKPKWEEASFSTTAGQEGEVEEVALDVEVLVVVAAHPQDEDLWAEQQLPRQASKVSYDRLERM